ncbi:unnamed protein product [Lampetra fluviatilis]
MSKHLRKKNLPVPLSEEEAETDEDELLGATALVPPADDARLDASQRRLGEDAATAESRDEWRLMAEQIESLRAILLNLVTAVASSPAVGRQIADQLDAAGKGPTKESGPAIAPATREDTVVLGGAAASESSAAILGAPATTRPPDAILPAPSGERERRPETPAARACHRGHRLPHIKEFTAGGDWSAFTWRFESAFRSVNWTEEEALAALPTLLDDVSLGVFRAIPASKKKTLRDAFTEMAEFYDPPTSATRKFMSRRRAPEESPLAYRGALMAMAMAAYPDAKAEHLDPLILSRMLELSQELNISLPVCGHEPLSSRWVARCLDAKFNIKRWDQMAAWTGKPEIDGPPLGWSPRLVVHCSDDSGDDDMLAAAVPRRIPGRLLRDQRGDYTGRPRARAGSSDRRPTSAACFKCGRPGHFTQVNLSSRSMDTRKTTRTHERGRDDDGVPGTPTSGGEDEELPPMQHFAVMADAPLASDTSLQDAHSRLAELLLAAAAVLADISVPASGKTAAGLVEKATLEGSRQKALCAKSLEVAAVFEGPPSIGGKHGHHVAGDLRSAQPTSSARAGALHFAPDNRADILHNYSGARENLSDVDDDRVLQQRLPALSAFKADGGDWGAFQ